jgi:hypothetical protein
MRTPHEARDLRDRIYWLAVLERALSNGEHSHAEEARRELQALGVEVRLGVVRGRPRRSPRRGTTPEGDGGRP